MAKIKNIRTEREYEVSQKDYDIIMKGRFAKLYKDVGTTKVPKEIQSKQNDLEQTETETQTKKQTKK